MIRGDQPVLGWISDNRWAGLIERLLVRPPVEDGDEEAGDKRHSSRSGVGQIADKSPPPRRSDSSSSAARHVEDKIQTILTNKGSLHGRRGRNILEEWALSNAAPSLQSSLLLLFLLLSSRPSALKRSVSRGSSGQREGRDVCMIKDGGGERRERERNACCEFVHVCVFLVNSND